MGFRTIDVQRPRRYTVDGQLANETITLTCEVEQVAYHGTNIAGTAITYDGPDKRLAPSRDHAEGLSVSQTAPILREWGYQYDQDKVQSAN
jgi:hypothetical protein